MEDTRVRFLRTKSSIPISFARRNCLPGIQLSAHLRLTYFCRNRDGDKLLQNRFIIIRDTRSNKVFCRGNYYHRQCPECTQLKVLAGTFKLWFIQLYLNKRKFATKKQSFKVNKYLPRKSYCLLPGYFLVVVIYLDCKKFMGEKWRLRIYRQSKLTASENKGCTNNRFPSENKLIASLAFMVLYLFLSLSCIKYYCRETKQC